MKTIRTKISVPFVAIIIIIPVVIMILFNISMNIYAERTAKNELRNTIAGLEVLVKQKVLNGYLDKLRGENANSAGENLAVLRSALHLSKIASNTEFLVISGENTVLFPPSFDDSFLTNAIINQTLEQLQASVSNDLSVLHIDGQKYYASYKALTGRARSVKLLFISRGNSANDIIEMINIILLVIMVIAAGAFVIIALGVSKSISRPITRLSGYAKRIGNGEFLTLPEDESSCEIRELTVSMNEMSERLRRYDSAQKVFLQNASHELRTPLMSIQGYAEGIAKGVFPDTEKTANIICEESRRLNTLVEELLTLSRIENQSYQEAPVILNLSYIIREYVQKIEGYAVKEGKKLRLDVRSSTINARIVDSLLLQAVLNIISNCIRFAKNQITITVFSADAQAVIRISDDGSGIPDADLPHIFERFYKGKKGSFGLGLAIAKSAIEYMGGNIKAYNAEYGAVFEIVLPQQ